MQQSILFSWKRSAKRDGHFRIVVKNVTLYKISVPDGTERILCLGLDIRLDWLTSSLGII